MGRVRSTTEEEKRQRRNMILEAAEKRLRRFGYSKTTMEEIAGDAGISKGTIYIYFKNKEEIFAELLGKEASDMERVIYAQIRDEADAVKQLKMIFTNSVEYLKRHPFLFSTLRRDVEMVSPRLIKHIFSIQDRLVSVIEDYVRRGIKNGEIADYNPKLLAYILYKVFEAFSYGSTMNEDEFSTKEIEAVIPELISKALAPSKKPARKPTKAKVPRKKNT
jgi:AcrR family transcriptional regulator